MKQKMLHFLLQAARTVLHSTESVQQMLCDWRNIDFEAIAHQAMWAFGKSQEEDRMRIKLCKIIFDNFFMNTLCGEMIFQLNLNKVLKQY